MHYWGASYQDNDHFGIGKEEENCFAAKVVSASHLQAAAPLRTQDCCKHWIPSFVARPEVLLGLCLQAAMAMELQDAQAVLVLVSEVPAQRLEEVLGLKSLRSSMMDLRFVVVEREVEELTPRN